MITALLLVTITVFLYLCYKIYFNKYKDINKLPGPSPLELIKELYFNRSPGGIVKYLQTLNEKYGPVVKIWLTPLKPVIITTDMEFCNKIFKNNDHHLSPTIVELDFAGEGISTTKDYNIWRHDKSIIMKAITREYIENGLKVYDSQYDRFLDIIRKNLGKPIDVQAHLHKIFLDIMLKSFENANTNLTEDQVSYYRNLKKHFFDLLLEKMSSPYMIGFLHKFTNNYKEMKKCVRELTLFVDTWLERFKKVEKQHREKHNLTYAMLEGGMPDRRIADNVTSMIQGGQDTSILPLALTFVEMSKRPLLQQKVQEEILSVIGPDINAHVTLDQLDRMPYIHALVKESVRMYIPFPFLDRQLLYDFNLNNCVIPKGTIVMFNFPGILKSELNYDNALTFNPERFLKEKLTMKERKAYIPFGYGLKICPGKDIAITAMKLLFVKIIREFEICPLEEGYKPEIVSEVFYRSLNGIPIVFRSRKVK